MAVNKITGFKAPYTSAVFRDIVDVIEGTSGLLDMDGPITQVGPTITVPAFRVVQNGLVVEKDTATTLSAPSMAAPYHLVVTAPTVNQIDDLMFTFAKTPEDISTEEVILGSYDGFEWRVPQKISVKGILDLIAQTNIDTLRVGPFDGLRTSLNGGNYDNSPGTLVDRQGEAQRFEEIASFPVVAIDPDWDRVDRIVYRRPTDSPARVGSREFLLGGTYESSPTALAAVESFDDSKVRQRQKVLIATNNTAHIFSASGSGTSFSLDYTKIASDRLSALVAPTTLITGLTSGSFGAAIDNAGNLHVVYVKSGNIFYRKYSDVGVLLVSETVIDTQSGACDNPRVHIDPASTQVFIVYQALMGPNNNQIFFTSRTLLGTLVTAPKNVASNAQNLITPDIFVSEDLYVYITWENDTLGSVLFRRFDDVGNPLDAAATTVSSNVEQIGVGTLTGSASDPRVLVAGNREVFVVFRQDKGGSAYGVSVYSGGSSWMQELTGPAESILSFDVATDPIFNSLMFTLVQASTVDFVKVYGQTVSFSLNLVAGGSQGVSVARDALGSLLHAVAAASAGTYTSYDAAADITAFGPVSVVGGVTTINVGANQFLVTVASLTQAPNIDDQVVITGSTVGGNNTTKKITNVELMSLDAIDDVYRVTVLNNFSGNESPATANGDFQSPDGSNAVYRKSVSEAQNMVFSLFELESDILLSRMLAPGTTILNWLPPGSAGSLTDFLILSGSGRVDWEATAVGEFTITGTLKMTNIFTATQYLLDPGSYPMAEGEALYVILDPSDLTPAPQVTPLPTLPWNQPIGVIGVIIDGKFEPSMPNLRPLSPGEEQDLGQALPVAIRDRLGIVDDVTYEPYTSTEQINPGDNYQEAISNLDTAVQNIVGQILMTPANPISTRVRISGVDKTFLNGSIFGIKYKDRLIAFDGAEIDFATGDVYDADGITPLGENFTPTIPSTNMWRWYAVNLLPGTVGLDNRLSIKFKLTPAASDGITQDAAPRATFTNQPDVGQVAVFSANGITIDDIDASQLVNLLTNFSTSEGSGAGPSQMLLAGDFTYDWEATAVGEFTFSSGLQIRDLAANVTWTPVDGSYAMAEDDAIYILLDTSNLTPTPQVAPIASLPVTSNIFIIGAIQYGSFVPTGGDLRVLETEESRVFGQDLSEDLKQRFGVVTDKQVDPYTSATQFDLADSYPDAISGIDAAIAKILGQITIEPKSPTSSRVVISGADQTLYNGSVLGMQVENLLIDWQGAEIDFETGETFLSDGITPLGTDFTPVIPAIGMWRWFAINLIPDAVTVDNRLTFTLLVTAALADGPTQISAVRAEFETDPKVGQVAINSTDGTTVEPIDYGNIVNLLTLDVGSGGGGSSVIKKPAGENLAENDLVYLSPGAAEGDTGRTQGEFYRVDAGNVTPALAAIRSQAVGFVTVAATVGMDAKVAMSGMRKNFVGLTPGIQYYADPSVLGGITDTKPSTEEQWIVPVGVPRSATQLDINPSMSSDAELVLSAVSSTDYEVNQTAHGFTVGKPIYFDGTNWQLAKADSAYTMAEGLVKEVVDVDNFIVRVVGPIEGLSGLTPGAYYFTDASTAGALTDTEPTSPFFSNPVGFALSATQIMVLPLRPSSGTPLPLSYFYDAVAGENLTEGDLVYLSPGSAQGDTARTQGRLYKCDAGNATPALAAIRSKAIGIVTITALAGVISQAQLAGEKSGFVGLVPGLVYYADPSTPGALTATVPTTVGQWIVPVGFGTSLTNLWINPAMAGRAQLIAESSAPTISITAGENLTANDAVYLSPGSGNGDTGRTLGQVYKCDSGNANSTLAAIRSQGIGFAQSTVLAAALATVQFAQKLAGFSSLVAGVPYYVDPATPGLITATRPTTLGQWVVPVGVAVSATEILVNPSMSPDSSIVALQSGIETISGLAGENLAANDLVYLSVGNANGDTGRTAGSYYKCDAGNANPALALIRSQGIGFAQAVTTLGNTVTVQRAGPMSGFSSLVAGRTYYGDPATPGLLTATKPTTSGQYVVPVGFARSTTDIQINPGISSDANLVATGGGLSAPVLKNSAYNLVSGDRIIADTVAGAFTLTLPPAPSVGDNVEIWDGQATWGTNNLTVDRNASQLEGTATNLVCNVSGGKVQLIYMAGSRGWAVIAM